MRAFLLAAAVSLALAGPAHATANLSCSIDDKGLRLGAEGIMGSPDWAPIENFDVVAELAEAPEAYRSVALQDALIQRWIIGDLINLHFHRIIEDANARVEINLRIETKFDEKIELMDHVGTYRLEFDVEPKTAAVKPALIQRDGPAACQLQ